MIWEERLIFRPAPARGHWRQPDDIHLEDVWLDAAGERIHAWWCPRHDATLTLLYCHGTMGNVSTRVASLKAWLATVGVSVLIFDYPGYGKSTGRPTEQGCYAAGLAAIDHLEHERLTTPEHLVIYGGSLGGAVAIELARQRPHHALVTLAAFTSLADMARKIAAYLPVERLLHTRFDNLAKIREQVRPLLVAHGAADHLVPFEHGKRLYEAAPAACKRFLPLKGVDHTESCIPEFYEGVRAFLQGPLAAASSTGHLLNPKGTHSIADVLTSPLHAAKP